MRRWRRKLRSCAATPMRSIRSSGPGTQVVSRMLFPMEMERWHCSSFLAMARSFARRTYRRFSVTLEAVEIYGWTDHSSVGGPRGAPAFLGEHYRDKPDFV